GLGLLDIVTELRTEKRLTRVGGNLTVGNGAAVDGYEIHMGVSIGRALERPAVIFHGDRGTDGAVTNDGNIFGTYLHGIFDSEEGLAAILKWAGLKTDKRFNYVTERDRSI